MTSRKLSPLGALALVLAVLAPACVSSNPMRPPVPAGLLAEGDASDGSAPVEVAPATPPRRTARSTDAAPPADLLPTLVVEHTVAAGE